MKFSGFFILLTFILTLMSESSALSATHEGSNWQRLSVVWLTAILSWILKCIYYKEQSTEKVAEYEEKIMEIPEDKRVRLV